MRLEPLSECLVAGIHISGDLGQVDTAFEVVAQETLCSGQPVVGWLLIVAFAKDDFAEKLHERGHCLDLLSLGFECGKVLDPENEPGASIVNLIFERPNGIVWVEETTGEPRREEWAIEGDVDFVPNLAFGGAVPMGDAGEDEDSVSALEWRFFPASIFVISFAAGEQHERSAIENSKLPGWVDTASEEVQSC